jgi:hypothetical protein
MRRGEAERREATLAQRKEEVAHRRLLVTHLPWAATLVLFSLVLIKVLVVSRFSRSTALVLLAASNIVSIALGVLVAYMPLVLLLAFQALYMSYPSTRAGSSERAVLVPLMIFTVGLAIWFVGFFFVVLVIPLLLLILFPDRVERWQIPGKMFREGRERQLRLDAITEEEFDLEEVEQELKLQREGLDRMHAFVNGVAVAAFLLLGLWAAFPFFSSDPWLARERLTFTDGSTRTGYVVAVSDDYVFMTANEHLIERFDASLVMARAVCVSRRPRTGFFVSLFISPAMLLAGPQPEYPLCPT